MRSLARFILLLLLLADARGQLLEWRAAIAANSSSKATFAAIEALPDSGPGNPDRAFTCGHFVGSFTFGPPPGLTNAAGSDGVVVRLSASPGWDIDWKAQAASSAGDVEIRDLSIAPGGEIYVCGVFTEDVQFTGSAFNFTRAGGPHGFVAWLNPDSGTWLGAYETPGIQPVSLVALAAGNVVLTGPGTLAARYSAAGAQLWSTAVPPGTTGWAHVATDPAFAHAYVMTRRPDPSSRDVALARLLLANGTVLWTKTMGSPGPDTTGGLDVAADGDVRLSFSSDHPGPSYDGIPVPGVPPVAAIHTVMGRIRPDGSPRWLVLVGLAQGPGALTSADLDCDAYGNAWLAARFDGPWKIESRIETGDDDAALIAVDGTGLLFDFHRSTGAATESPLGVAAPVKTLAMLAGEFQGTGSTFPNRPPFPARANPEAFVTIASPVPVQDHYVFRPAGPTPPTPQQIVDILDQAGLQVYAIAQNSTTGLAVSAHATPGQINDLATNPNIAFELEANLASNGSNADAGWALGRLNNPTASASTTNTFTYPDTGGEVVVYLIDTAVDELAGWFAGNANLSIEESTLIRGAGDPTKSSSFEHGTQVLSMLAGPSCGPAVGTPVRLVNFDIYPSGSSSYTTLLNDAILEAIDHRATNHPRSPALICIASSTSAPATSATVSAALSIALAEGFPLVLSAGNSGANAANYVPQRYASAGILCTGASDTSNARSAISNFGSPVDLYAPGASVRAVDYSNPTGAYDAFSGTSASAALVAGIAAVHLSVNPWQTPDELESAVLADVHAAAVKLAQLSADGPAFTGSFSDWAAWHDLASTDTAADSDGDGVTDGMEFVLGGDPCTHDDLSPVAFSFDGLTAELSFTVSAVLHDPATPSVLRDGTTWEIKSSTDLSTWSRAAGTFGFGSAASSRIPVTLTDTPADPACFFRLEISHAP
jgi:hypothetical protein